MKFDPTPLLALAVAAGTYIYSRTLGAGIVFVLALAIYLVFSKVLLVRNELETISGALLKQVEATKILEKRIDQNHHLMLEQVGPLKTRAVAEAVARR